MKAKAADETHGEIELGAVCSVDKKSFNHKFNWILESDLEMKMLRQFPLLFLFVPWLTGCACTSKVFDLSSVRTVDTFNPSAVYRQATNHDGFALEGTRKNGEKSFHAFLVIPDYLLACDNLQKNENLSLAEITKLETRKAENFPGYDLESKRKLPLNYEKISVLPHNDINIEVEEHHPGGAWAFLLPVAFVADIVTFPVQLCVVMNRPWKT